ncbi:MAG: chorismate mutase [Actinobacteria bacterium]|nr:chorismate mutase [Actinomycetota bacterium]
MEKDSNDDFKEKLNHFRKQIDEIDKALVDYLNRRAKVVLEIRKLKEKHNIPLFDAKREEELMNNIVKYNKGPLYNDNILEIFECILRNIQILERNENL